MKAGVLQRTETIASLLHWAYLSRDTDLAYFLNKYGQLLYGKPSPRQIPVLWLVLSRSGFCSTDHFHGNGPIRVFLFWSKAGKFNVCNQDSENKVWKLSFFALKLPAEAKKIELFPKFQRWMKNRRRWTFFKCKSPEVHFTIRNRVPYNELLTNRACLGRTREYWPSVVFVRTSLRSVRTVMTSGQYSPVRPSHSVSKRLLFNFQVTLKTHEEEKKTLQTKLQVAQKDLATIRDRESKLSSEKVIYIIWFPAPVVQRVDST